MILPSHTRTEPMGIPPAARPFLASSIAARRKGSVVVALPLFTGGKLTDVIARRNRCFGSKRLKLLLRSRFRTELEFLRLAVHGDQDGVFADFLADDLNTSVADAN